MKKIITMLLLMFATTTFACEECGGFCGDSSRVPKVDMQGNFLIYTNICNDLFEGKHGFLEHLINFDIIESDKDVVVWSKDLIVLKSKKKVNKKSSKKNLTKMKNHSQGNTSDQASIQFHLGEKKNVLISVQLNTEQ